MRIYVFEKLSGERVSVKMQALGERQGPYARAIITDRPHEEVVTDEPRKGEQLLDFRQLTPETSRYVKEIKDRSSAHEWATHSFHLAELILSGIVIGYRECRDSRPAKAV